MLIISDIEYGCMQCSAGHQERRMKAVLRTEFNELKLNEFDREMGFAYKITDQRAVHFITCTVAQWVDVFTRAEYADILERRISSGRNWTIFITTR